MNKLLLVDGNSILNRAFYGLPDLTTADGRHTGAILGFLNIMMRVIEETNATHLVIAFDMKHPTFRHEMFAEYKGTRHAMPPELAEQTPRIREVLSTMGVTFVERPGFEADDIIGTLSRRGEKEDFEVVILSGDRDLLQLATDKIMIKLPKTKAGNTVVMNYFAADVKAEYGVDPITFIDMKGLMGDSSDNIPGVPKIGQKTAEKLLSEFGSMDGLYANIDSLKPSKNKENLIEFKEQAYLSKELATIKLDVPLDDVSISDAAIGDMFNEASYRMFTDLELKSLLRYFGESVKKPALVAHIQTVEDFDAYLTLMEKAKSAERLAFDLFDDAGASLTLSDDLTYLIAWNGFVNASLFVSDIEKLISGGKHVSVMDVKSLLGRVSISDSDDCFDCGLASYLINPLMGTYDYASVAGAYLDAFLPDEKELLKKKKPDADTFADADVQSYMAYLSLVPFLADPILDKKLREDGMEELYRTIEYPCLFTLYEMEKNGIRVDKEGLTAFGEKLSLRINELEASIHSLAGETFNINSTKKLGEILFEKLGLPSGKKTKTGYSTSVEVLEKIAGEHEIVPMILEYRQLNKLFTTYVEGLVPYIREDGRIHGIFNQTVTATGRISSSDPNLQNIPTRLPLGREIRKVFVPEEGYIFLDADYSQIELRVLAHLSGDEALIDAYKKNADIHAITASQVFGVPIDSVDSLMRRRAKAVNFGIVYGISSFGLGQDLDISRKEAEAYIQRYFETYGDVKKYIDSCVTEGKEKGYSVTMFGRRRPLPELKSSNFMTRSFGERVAMNAPIQGTAADIVKLAMINVNRALKKRNLSSRLILQVHDELMIETKIEEKDEVLKILQDEMMHAAELSVPLLTDVGIGGSWYDAK